MKILLIMCCTIAVLFNANIDAQEQASSKQCTKWRDQAAVIDQKLHDGYTTKQGNKLRAKYRNLRSLIYRRCK